MKIALPIEYEKAEEPIFDVCVYCQRRRVIAYALDGSHEWICRSCGEREGVTPLSSLQAKVFLSYKQHHQQFHFTPVIAKDLGLDQGAVRRVINQLVRRGIEIVCRGKKRTHRYQIPAPSGELIAVDQNQWEVYQLVMLPELLRSPTYLLKAALIANASMFTMKNNVARLRQKGIYVPTQSERRLNLLAHLKQRIEQEQLDSSDLLSPKFCSEIGVAKSSMGTLIRDLRGLGVDLKLETLGGRICQEIRAAKRMSRQDIVIRLGDRWSTRTIQRSLNSLLDQERIACLNLQSLPSKRIYVEMQP